MTMQGALTFASWTTPTRPSSPATFATGWNTTLGELETWNGSTWVAAVGSGIYLPLAGGEITGNLTVDGTTTIKSGTIDSATLGATTAAAAKVTTLTASSTVTLSPANTTVTISPSGTGTVVINPATASAIDNAAIGTTTPLGGKFTTLAASSTVSGAGITALMASPGPIGSTAPGTGAFTTLAASSTVSGTGFSTYLASPPAIGGTAPANGTFLTLKGALKNYLSGGQISAPGGATTLTIQVAAAADSTNTIYMESTGVYTKTTASWVVGSGNGMLDTGTTGGAASTWYHLYEIIRPDTGVVDFLMSLSASSPTLPTNYTKFRRIGSFLLDGSKNIVGVAQNGDRFDWLTPVNDVVTNTPGATTGALVTLASVPSGVIVQAILTGNYTDPSAGSLLYISSPGQTDVAAGVAAITAQVASGALTAWQATVATNTSQQVRRRVSSTTGNFLATTNGWIDTRGKN